MELAILYDDAFLHHVSSSYHPESPERLVAFRAALEKAGIWEGASQVPAREARHEELERVHSPAYVESTLRRIHGGWGHLDPDTFYSPGTERAALLAAGGGVDLARRVCAGENEAGLALVRPPGHHAEAGRAMGFCIFNNVAVAAAALLEDGLARVLIFDPDVHHGNGTQHQFEESSKVLYVSFHQFPHYPGSGGAGEVGRGPGRGYTVNVPFPWAAADADYAEAVDRVLVPLAREFRPEAILVSVGFDAHTADPLAGMDMTEAGYGYLAAAVRDLATELCRGRLVFFLEGGYEIEAAAASLVRVVEVVRGAEAPRPEGAAGARHRRAIDAALEAVSPFRPLSG